MKNNNYIKELSNIMYMDYNFTQKEIAETLGVNKLKFIDYYMNFKERP